MAENRCDSQRAWENPPALRQRALPSRCLEAGDFSIDAIRHSARISDCFDLLHICTVNRYTRLLSRPFGAVWRSLPDVIRIDYQCTTVLPGHAWPKAQTSSACPTRCTAMRPPSY